MADEAPADTPLLRVVCGAPTGEELAALVAVVGALREISTIGAGHSPTSSSSVGSSWAAPAARLRKPLAPGPDGWRRSSLLGARP